MGYFFISSVLFTNQNFFVISVNKQILQKTCYENGQEDAYRKIVNDILSGE